MVFNMELRLVGTAVSENPKTQDATIVTRMRGPVTREVLAMYSEAVAKTVFDGRVWGSSLSTGMQPGLWMMKLCTFGGEPMAAVPHCRLKDLRFAPKTVKDGKVVKVIMFVTVVVEHENCPAQKTIVCAVPSNVLVRLESEPEELARVAVGF